MENVLKNKQANRVSNPGVSYSQEDWARGYESQRHEDDYWIDQVEGEIPKELRGTWLRNGPGLLDINGYRVHHPFDGDGMICAIAFATFTLGVMGFDSICRLVLSWCSAFLS